MKVFLAALLLVGLCVAGLCFNIIFIKGGQFPQTEIENNDEMKKLGIKCAKAEEMALWSKKKKGKPSCSGEGGSCTSCAGCSFHKEQDL